MNGALIEPSDDEINILCEEDSSLDEDIDVASVITEKLETIFTKTTSDGEFDATRAYLKELSRSNC